MYTIAKTFFPQIKGMRRFFHHLGVDFWTFELQYLKNGAEFRKNVLSNNLELVEESKFAEHTTPKKPPSGGENLRGGFLGVVCSAKLFSSPSSLMLLRTVF